MAVISPTNGYNQAYSVSVMLNLTTPDTNTRTLTTFMEYNAAYSVATMLNLTVPNATSFLLMANPKPSVMQRSPLTTGKPS